jgi:hypothetical protein
MATGLAAGLLAAGASPSYAEAEKPEPLAGATSASDPLERDLYLPFNDLGSLPVIREVLSSSDVRVAVSSAAGGEVLPGPDRSESGHSLRLEPFRADRSAQPAVVVVEALGGDDPTDPGRGDFSFGAEFVLDAHHGSSSTDNGDNLVQRGLFGEDAQYKIQLDDARPSCRVNGSEGSVTVRAAERVETGEWYRVRCRRTGDEVSLRVVTSFGEGRELRDYVEHGRTGSVSFAGGGPFSIGGKVDKDGDVLTADSDQFNGLVDDVFFRQLS